MNIIKPLTGQRGPRGPRGEQGPMGSLDGFNLLTGEDDPRDGAGVEAAMPALYFRVVGGVGSLFVKVGAADTAWQPLVTGTFAEDITAPRFLGSALGSNNAPVFSFADDPNTGIYSEAGDTVSVTAGGTRYARVRSAGVEALNTGLIAMNQFIRSGTSAPDALAANANDYSPTNLSASSVLLQDATTDVTITGLAGGGNGRRIGIVNTSTSTITLAHESESSAAGNRFALALAQDLDILPGQGVELLYVGATSRWRALAWGEPNII